MSGERSNVSLLSKQSPHRNLHCSSEARRTRPAQIWGWSSVLVEVKAAQPVLVSGLVQFNQTWLSVLVSPVSDRFDEVQPAKPGRAYQSLPPTLVMPNLQSHSLPCPGGRAQAVPSRVPTVPSPAVGAEAALAQPPWHTQPVTATGNLELFGKHLLGPASLPGAPLSQNSQHCQAPSLSPAPL